MGYAQLTDGQLEKLFYYTKGKVVHDLGAGGLELAHLLCAYNARKVIAIDKEIFCLPVDPCVEVVRSYFADYREPIDVALISWPTNYHEQGLLDLLERARIVIYIGKNTDGSWCGTPSLFWTLLSRRLLAYVPHRRNVLAVYGSEVKHLRKPTGEELAGLQLRQDLYRYEEAEMLASVGSPLRPPRR